MKTSIESTISHDFLRRLSPVKVVSKRHSPKASALARNIKMAYPPEMGGTFRIESLHVIDAAKMRGLAVLPLPDGDAHIGVKTEDLHALVEAGAVFDDEVCRHGYLPITFVLDSSCSRPKVKGCCRRCTNGRENPSKLELQQARKYLQGMPLKSPPLAGAVILAARQLGHVVYKTAEGKLRFEKNKKSVHLPGTPKAVQS